MFLILRFNMNFSVYGIMDLIHHTQGNFEETQSFKHHRTLYTFKSIREVCNDEAETIKEE
jgi:hypothetical protein